MACCPNNPPDRCRKSQHDERVRGPRQDRADLVPECQWAGNAEVFRVESLSCSRWYYQSGGFCHFLLPIVECKSKTLITPHYAKSTIEDTSAYVHSIGGSVVRGIEPFDRGCAGQSVLLRIGRSPR